MADIKVYRLPKTTDPVLLNTHSRPLRLARLKALQVDAKAFKSKYEDEITQPPEFWLNRLRPENCQHFVAEVPSSNDTKDVEYKAVMVVLSPSIPMEEHNIPTYMLAAFWVDPEVRGRKVGSKVFEESVQWVREDARKNDWKQIRYELHVKPSNDRAINLYNRLGFLPVSKSSEEEEEETTPDDYLAEMRMTIDIS